MRQGISVVLFCLLLTGRLLAAPAPKEHPAKADLIADVAAVQPGQAFHVAVRIQMNPGYHVYWVNPGDSGTGTDIKFKAPDGWKVEPLQMPTPHRIQMPGDIVNFGYEGTVLFLARVTPPADAKGSADLSAVAEWLVCNEDRCIPGGAKPSLKLAVAEKAQPANEALFRDWLATVPTPLEDVIPGQFGNIDPQKHTFTFKPKQPLKNPELFFAPGDQWQIENPELKHGQNASSLTFTSKPVLKETQKATMLVLIAYEDDQGKRRSVYLNVPLIP